MLRAYYLPMLHKHDTCMIYWCLVQGGWISASHWVILTFLSLLRYNTSTKIQVQDLSEDVQAAASHESPHGEPQELCYNQTINKY